MYLLLLLISLGASTAGAVCGVGGGVIIKPVLDAFGIMDVSTISFLSGCTVLTMTSYSVIKSLVSKAATINVRIIVLLAIGSAAGGMLGKWIFTYISELYPDANKIGALQAGCLLVVTVGCLFYALARDKIKTRCITGNPACILCGVLLGMLSSFLGIGGGPMNLVFLFYFFSMTTKEAAGVSLYIIFFSQLFSLLSSIFTDKIPKFSFVILIYMVLGGFIGGMIGRSWNHRLKDSSVDRMFMMLMLIMIAVNIYNIYKFI